MNWDKRLARAVKKGKFSDADMIKSNDAFKCSLGEHIYNLHDQISGKLVRRYCLIEHTDDLFNEFRNHVYENDIERATQIHNEIKTIEMIT